MTGGPTAASSVVRHARVPGGAARSQTRADPAQDRHHAGDGLHAQRRSAGACTATGTCSTQPRKDAARRATCQPEETEQNLYADGYKPPAGSKPKAVRVNPGTVLVQARPVESASGKITQQSPNSCYVLNDEPVLEGNNITNPAAGLRRRRRRHGRPNVNFGFTSARQERVRTRHQGNRPPRPGSAAAGGEQGSGVQHFAIGARRPADHRAVDRLQRSTPKGSTPPRARRSQAASRSPPRRNSPTSCSPARCRSAWN